MLSMELVLAITDQRERDIRERARVARLLDAARLACEAGRTVVRRATGYRVVWRATTPRASATTR
jgi:hypothetical protein